MRGQNINIYLPYTTFLEVENLIKERKISSFVNDAILKEINEKKRIEKEAFKNSMIAAYKRTASNKSLQEELEVWDQAVGDGLDEEDEWNFKDVK